MPRYITDMPDSELVGALYQGVMDLPPDCPKWVFQRSMGSFCQMDEQGDLVFLPTGFDYATGELFYYGPFAQSLWCNAALRYSLLLLGNLDNVLLDAIEENPTNWEESATSLLTCLASATEIKGLALCLQSKILTGTLPFELEQIWLEFTLRYPFDMD